MATLSSILAWRIPWTEEPGVLQSVKLLRVRHDAATRHTYHVLVSAVQQSESMIYTRISPPSGTPTPTLEAITEHWAGLPVLFSSLLLAGYRTHGAIYMWLTSNINRILISEESWGWYLVHFCYFEFFFCIKTCLINMKCFINSDILLAFLFQKHLPNGSRELRHGDLEQSCK